MREVTSGAGRAGRRPEKTAAGGGPGYNPRVSQSIKIAGGGLSGLATAVLLARQGVEVEVYDRHRGGGGRFTGGWQVLENESRELDALAELRAIGLAPDFPAIPATRALFLDGSERRFEVASAAPYAYFVRRGGAEGSLDSWLRRLALGAGVVLREGVAAPPDADVIASGPRQADGVAQVRRVRSLAAAREAAWRRFREVLGEFDVRDGNEHGQFMNFSLPRHLRGEDGRWHVGEEAGVQDFLFGLGNRLALRSAGLAAAGIAGRWDGAAFRSTLLRPMRTTVALRFVYERMGRRAFAAFCSRASRGDFRRFLIRLQRPDAAKDAIARLVMAAWRERHGCRHTPLCVWCRERES